MTRQQAFTELLGRTSAASNRQNALVDGVTTYDIERIADIAARLKEASPFPWKVASKQTFQGNWPIMAVGNDSRDGKDYYITTDHIHGSEMVSGGARPDAEFIAHAPQDVQYLIRLVNAQQQEIWRLQRPDAPVHAKQGRGPLGAISAS